MLFLYLPHSIILDLTNCVAFDCTAHAIKRIEGFLGYFENEFVLLAVVNQNVLIEQQILSL
jgi:hypothetical protein